LNSSVKKDTFTYITYLIEINTMTLPIIAQKGTYAVDVEEGQKYFWCTCGLSANQPFCDGAHKGSGMKSLPFVAESTSTVYLCGCKKTGNGPFCDGTHSGL
jgi:CDGSH iron-sulfur domain-containing protein 3